MKKKILIITALVLVLSFFVIRGSYALYRSISNIGGNMGLATWTVTLNQSGVNNHLSVIAGDSTSTASYTVNITSNAEVDITYSITVDNIPSGVTVELDQSGTFVTPTNNKVIFADVDTINYSDASHDKSHILTFKADSGATIANNQAIDINVLARQLLHNE